MDLSEHANLQIVADLDVLAPRFHDDCQVAGDHYIVQDDGHPLLWEKILEICDQDIYDPPVEIYQDGGQDACYRIVLDRVSGLGSEQPLQDSLGVEEA